MTYSVRYKNRGALFWTKLKNVKGDFMPADIPGFRVFILDDESRIEVPIEDTEFRFCSKRFLSIKQQMEREAGQPIPVK